MSHPSKSKLLHFYLLQLSFELLKLDSHEESSRMSKEIYEIFLKLSDFNIIGSSKILDQMDKARKSTSEIERHEKKPSESVELSNEEDVAILVCSYFVEMLHKNLFLSPDRLLALCNNLVYYFVSPHTKSYIHSSVRCMFANQMIEKFMLFPDLFKIWRKDFWDSFVDSRFFLCSLDLIQVRRRILKFVVTMESDRLEDLMYRSPYAGGTLFTSKEIEIANHCSLLKRISFILFAGEKDQFLHDLPQLTQKIVELFKIQSKILWSELLLMLRVVLLRFSNQYLEGLWPIILTHLLQLFLEAQSETSLDDEQLGLLFSGCKFLDIMFTLTSDEVLTYQWIFLSDSDVSESSSGISAIGVLDTLKEIWLKRRSKEPEMPEIALTRRPILLQSVVTNISEIEEFIFAVGKHVVHQTIHLLQPDISFVEQLLEKEYLE